MKNFIIAAVLFITINCAANIKKTPLPKEFFTCWKAAYEENDEKAKTQVYRPCTNEFGPSMFRLSIEFTSNGNCKYLHAGPTDNHYYVEGKWKYNSKTKVVTVLDDKKKLAYKFKVIETKSDILKVSSLL